MRNAKKLKKILAVMTASVTMSAMLSTAAMAAPSATPRPSDSITDSIPSDAPSEYPATPSESDAPSDAPSEYPSAPSRPDYPSSDPNIPSDAPSEYPSAPSEPDYPSSPSEPDYPSSPSEPDYPPSQEMRPEPPMHEEQTEIHNSVTYEPLQIIEEQTAHTYVKGSGTGVTITSNGEYSKFFSVFVDGAILDQSCFTVQRGSTILTLMPEYLETLPVGAHTVTMNYTYGSVDSVLNVEEKNAPTSSSNVSSPPQQAIDELASVTDKKNANTLKYEYKEETKPQNQANNNTTAGNTNAVSTGNTTTPKTGDTSAVLFWSLLVLASGCSCVVLIRRKRMNSR